MPRGYKYYEIQNLPVLSVGQVFTTSHQEVLEVAEVETPAHSTLRFIGNSDHPLYEKYFVQHERERNKKVRIGTAIRNRIIEIEEFHLFVPKDRSYVFAGTKETYCDEFFTRLRSSYREFEFRGLRINLAKLRAELEMSVRGGWFKNLTIADVRTAGIFGSKVSESDDWSRYEQSGILSALTLELEMQGIQYNFQLLRDGGTVLYDPLSERDCVEFLQNIRDLIYQYAEAEI